MSSKSPSSPADTLATGRERSTLREGFAVMGVAIRRQPWVFTLSTLGSLLFGALTVADAWVLGWSTNNVLLPAFETGTTTGRALIAVVALFVGVALLRAVGIVGRRLGAGIMQYRLHADYRRELSAQYLRLPISWHQRHPAGQLLSNANADVEAAWAPIAPLPMAVGTVAMLAIAVVQMLIVDLPMAAVGLTVFPLVAVATLTYQYFSSPLFTRVQALRSELSEIAHESFDGAMVVKTLGREQQETDRFAVKTNELRDLGIRIGRMRAVFDPMVEAIPSLGVLGVLLVGAWQVSGGRATAGDVVTIAYLLTIVSFPIRSIGWLLGEFPRSVVGYDRVQHVLDEAGFAEYGTQVVPVGAAEDAGARLAFDDVRFSYQADRAVLDGLTFEVEPGRTVAIVGETAAGKSTVTMLVARLVDPDAGAVSIDGIDLRDLAPGELARHLALVPQTAFLFDDTVRGNVTLGEPIGDDQVWAALRTAQADGFVAALPDGLDTRLGERGASLSGGQRQRIALARALARAPRLLVLDDATSAVDPEVEARILAAMREARAEHTDTSPTGGGGGAGATMILVAYRKATIGLADEVLFLKDGRIVDRGTHQRLLGRNRDYATLVNAYEADPDLPHEDAQSVEVGR